MTAPLIELSKLEKTLTEFAQARNWTQFHSPKNLAMALTGEVGELVEIFQWLSEAESKLVAHHPHTSEAVRDELADVFIYLVRMAQVLEVDLNQAITQKLQKNAHKYPAIISPDA
ncbi:nucleotide pyrophosphohydrolase [Parvibium lacunae]|uniref:Nucleotide pyrophosphohydrolase n=1 Tax=Parvibium lacunae TaxID=1888893 RepID=A0A368L3N1_9BURK|nr:nucleotide pyrophosphohydrolase [Parvibium lacunae]RCS58179.1 nucleotide pyrophosphohydrolase [Parvibium lacunae]